jgi:hypothetical protein
LNIRSLVTRSRHLSSGRESVMNTLNRFLWCMDRNDPDTFASLFTDDGTLEITKTNKIYDSPLLIKGFCSDIYTKFSPALHLVSLSLLPLLIPYQESNFVINIDSASSRATNESYWWSQLGGEVMSTGFHYDELVFEKNRWLFKRRVTTHHWTKAGGFESR